MKSLYELASYLVRIAIPLVITLTMLSGLPSAGYAQEATWRDNILVLPEVAVGTLYYSIDLTVLGTTSEIIFQLSRSDELSGSYGDLGIYYQGGTLTVPDIEIDGVSNWAILELIGRNNPKSLSQTSSEFRLVATGANDGSSGNLIAKIMGDILNENNSGRADGDSNGSASPIVISLAQSPTEPAYGLNDKDRELVSASGNNPFDMLMARLDTVMARLDELEAKLDDPAQPSATATFCTSQARSLGLSGGYGAELNIGAELGGGWAEIGDLKFTGNASFPAIGTVSLPGPPPLFIPIPVASIPLPTEAGIGLGADIGRATDVCIDIPVELAPGDEERMLALAVEINEATEGFAKSKFQRRADRLLSYTERQISNPGGQELFDRADEALRSILDEGLKGAGEDGMAAFKDANIRELMASIDLPVNVFAQLDTPEQIFDGLPDISGGFQNLSCENIGASLATIGSNARLAGLCDEIEKIRGLDYASTRDVLGNLPDALIDPIADLIGPLLLEVDELVPDAEDKAETKSKFCNSNVGQRKVWDNYCGR